MISQIDIYRYSIPMVPFTIATGTMFYAQNIFIRVHTTDGMYGVGECSAFPMIAGETQNTCFEMAKDFAAIWKGKDESQLEERIGELHLFTAFNSTIKSAFDMSLYDLAAKKQGTPLYKFLGGAKRLLETDLTIGIGTPEEMAAQAIDFKGRGVRILKVKLGKDASTDVERIKAIREAVGDEMLIRIDANQGWSFEDSVFCLNELYRYNIQFCEQPMRHWDDDLLSALRDQVAIPIMADESVFDHHDAARLIRADACDFINIKLAKSGGILEALKIHETCKKYNIPCMMGGMLESRVALTAFAHLSLACEQVQFYDMDTCMLGHKIDPVKGGVKFHGFELEVPETPGVGADVEDDFLKTLEMVRI